MTTDLRPPTRFLYEKRLRQFMPAGGSKVWDEKTGRPLALPTFNATWGYGLDSLQVLKYDEARGRDVTNHPAGCVGPVLLDGRARKTKRAYPCGRPLYCLFCWERDRWARVPEAFIRFYEHPTFKVSLNLLSVKTPDDARRAQGRFRDALKAAGVDNYWVACHTHGDTPTRGLSFGIDALFVAKKRPDFLANISRLPGFDEFQRGDDGHTIAGQRFYIRRIKTDRRNLGSLIHHARYTPRKAWEPRRIHAGLWTHIEDGIYHGFGSDTFNLNADDRNHGRCYRADWYTLCRLQIEANHATNKTRLMKPRSLPDLHPKVVKSVEDSIGNSLLRYRLKSQWERLVEARQ